MTLREILQYEVIHTDKLTISVYQLAVFLIIILITWLVMKLIKRVLHRRIKSRNLNPGNTMAIFQIVKYIIWVLVIGVGLETIGVKFNILIASSAALLVGIGLGLQQVFMDYVAGIIIIIEGIIRVNDVVELEDLIGEVKYIGLRTSRLETRDDYVVVVPNHKLVNDRVVNWSHNRRLARFNVAVGVAYGSDIRLVEKILLEVAVENKLVAKSPEPFVRFTDFGNSSLDFQLFFFTEDSFRVESTKSALRFRIDDKFRENGVTIPFPQRDVHIKKM